MRVLVIYTVQARYGEYEDSWIDHVIEIPDGMTDEDIKGFAVTMKGDKYAVVNTRKAVAVTRTVLELAGEDYK